MSHTENGWPALARGVHAVQSGRDAISSNTNRLPKKFRMAAFAPHIEVIVLRRAGLVGFYSCCV